MNHNTIKRWITNNLFTKENKVKSISKKHKLYNDNIELFNIINKTVNIDTSISQKCKLFIQEIYDYPKCYCGNEIKKYTKTKSDILFYKCCSIRCSGKSPERIIKVIKTKKANNSYVSGCIKGYFTKLNNIDENGINGAIRNGQKTLQTKNNERFSNPIR